MVTTSDLHRRADRCRGLPRPLPRARLLPNLVTDGFSQARLRVYISHAPSPGPVALQPQMGLTGSGSHIPSYGGFGGGHRHFHPHTSRGKPAPGCRFGANMSRCAALCCRTTYPLVCNFDRSTVLVVKLQRRQFGATTCLVSAEAEY